jgi:adenylyltransferase/sulfurtransferase
MNNTISPSEQLRYNRQIILPGIGEEGQKRLKKARVLVVGCGGLGSPVLQYLAAAGTGCLSLVDGDIVSESNLQRQILYATEDIGLLKTEVATKKLQALNPLVNIQNFPCRFHRKNASDLLSKHDLVIDCTDNFETRYLINDVCVEQNKPMVYGAVFEYEGQAAVFNYQGSITYRELFPESPANALPTSTIGVLGIIPGVIGLIQATEALKIITGVGKVLNQLLVYNALNTSFLKFDLPQTKKEV